MKINFIGGANKVTGTCYSLQIQDSKIMIDCGMEQGNTEDVDYNQRLSSCHVHDELLVTHCHIDHIAMIPLAVKKNKVRSIVSTLATKELSILLLNDYLKISASEGKNLYDEEDIINAVLMWETVDHGIKVNKENYSYTLLKNSHIIGSASLFIESDDGNLLFTSDIGTANQLLMDYPPTIPADNVDYLIIETTYGDKNHKPRQEESGRLITKSLEVLNNGGKVIIPTFAIGRTQEILYTLSNSEICGKFPIYIDTPLGNKVTNLMEKYVFYLKNSISKKLLRNNLFGEYNSIGSDSESKLIAASNEPYIVLSASGMLEGGRVLNHFNTVKDDKKSLLMFCGYQGYGTRGQKVLSQEVKVSCSIDSVSGFSAHASQSELLEYIERLKYTPYKTYLIHGDAYQRMEFSKALTKLKLRHELPTNNDVSSGINIEKKQKFFFDIDLKFENINGKVLAPINATAVKDGDNIHILNANIYEEARKECIKAEEIRDVADELIKRDITEWSAEFSNVVIHNQLIGKNILKNVMSNLSTNSMEAKTILYNIAKDRKYNKQAMNIIADNKDYETILMRSSELLIEATQYNEEELFNEIRKMIGK